MAKFCSNCGKELEDGQNVCLGCGRLIGESKSNIEDNSKVGKKNSMAQAGFITALISLILNFGGIVGITATVLSGVGLSQIKNTGEEGKGIATAGLIIGIISIFYGLWTILNYL